MVDWYGVDSLDEAVLVREHCQNDILILGYVSPDDATEVVRGKFSTLVYTHELAEALSRSATPENPAKIHIKVDTGLVRLGLWPDEAIDFARKASTLPNTIIEGLYTHYAKVSDDQGNKTYLEQLEKFKSVADSLAEAGIHPRVVHTASSFATVLHEDTHGTMVRIGIVLYGLWGREASSEFVTQHHREFKLTPAITWKTTVINVKKIPSNTGVGYGHSTVVLRDTIVAVLGAGYYDGIDKRYGKIGHVLINGKRAKVLGGIAMNMCMVDVTDIERVRIGDPAILIGRSGDEEITAYEFAAAINTSTYELISRINPSLQRRIVS